MLNIYLARHGQDEDNKNGLLNGHRDTLLTDLGMNQAHTLGGKIKEKGIIFDVVYCSPLKRTSITAQIVTEILGLDLPVPLDNLIERNLGVMTGQPIEDIPMLCAPDILKTPQLITYFLKAEGAETFPELLDRGRLVLNEIKSKHITGNILLVTHGDMGKMIYAAYHDLDWKDVLTMFHFGNAELLLLSENSKPEETHIFNFEQHNH